MSPRVLVIDNYDSFTFNLVQELRSRGAEVLVRRNDEVDPAGVLRLEPTHLVLSPGPGAPRTAGNSMAIVERLLGRLPLLGVCLGHQTLAAVLGAQVRRAQAPVHGKAERIFHDGRGLYRGLPNPFDAGRYHSLTVAEDSLPPELEISAYTRAGDIMGLRHRTLRAEGVQFHPESVLTPRGGRLLRNFLARQGASLSVEVPS